MRILIRGGGLINKGAEAMVLTAKAEVSTRIPNSVFYLPADCMRHKSESTHAEKYGFQINQTRQESRIRDLGRIAKAWILTSFKMRDLWRRREDHLETLKMLDGIDAVLDVHGYAFGDPWGEHYATRTALFVEHCRALGKPYIFLPQSWGPFQRKSTLGRYRAICKGAAALFARDEASQVYVANLLGKPQQSIATSPDIAFRFRAASTDEADQLLGELGLKKNAGPLVGIAPNMRVYERAPGADADNAYLQILIKISQLFMGLGATVLLIPHEIKAQQPVDELNDDRLLIMKVAKALGDKRVVAMTGNYTAPQIKSIISRLDLLIGSRFHALVGALSSHVPVVALGWSHKYVELLRDVGLEDYCTGHDELDWDQVRQKVMQAWTERDALSAKLRHCMPAIQSKVDHTFDQVAEALKR